MATVTQERFAQALADRERPIPDGLAAWNGARPDRRFAVYRNNVFWGLTESLKSRFPATMAIVGEDFFSAMAAEYIRLAPPRSPLLLGYGDTLADFVARFEPAAGLPYLPDVIRLEAARSHAYHAEDVRPLDADDLSSIDPQRLPSLVLTPHPSLSVLRSPYPVVTIWAMNSGEMAVGPIDGCAAEDALVVRPGMIVHVHRLGPGGAAFVQALGGGLSLGDSVSAAVSADCGFDLATNLAGILQSGAFAAFE